MSGLSHTPGKRARGYTLRGFESRLLRQLMSIHAGFNRFSRTCPRFPHGENVRPEYAKRIDKARTSSGLLFLLQQKDSLWIPIPK